MRAPKAKERLLPVEICLLAAIYAAVGLLGQRLAIPPGNVTAFWPPSGIALAALLLRGSHLWPGVLLGSFLVNTPAFFDASSASRAAVTATVGALIALGADVRPVVYPIFKLRKEVR